MTLYRKKTGGTERGVALVIALLVLLLITAVGMGMIMMSNTETNISANFRDEQTAFFSAKAGIEEVRDRLRNFAPGTLRAAGVLPTTFVGTPNSVLYVLNPAPGEVVAPWNGGGNNYPDDEICKETTTVPCTVNVVTGRSMPSGG